MNFCSRCGWLMEQCICKPIVEGDVPVNSAPYWKEQCDQLRAENEKLLWQNEELRQALAGIVEYPMQKIIAWDSAKEALANARGGGR